MNVLFVSHNLIIEMIDVDRFRSVGGSQGVKESPFEFATVFSDMLARVFPNKHHLPDWYTVSSRLETPKWEEVGVTYHGLPKSLED